MKQRSSWESDSLSAGQELTRPLDLLFQIKYQYFYVYLGFMNSVAKHACCCYVPCYT
jgi:hypothetical protein